MKLESTGTLPFKGMPDQMQTEVDKFYDGLKQSRSLLENGAQYGLVVTISPELASLIRARKGEESEEILELCTSNSASKTIKKPRKEPKEKLPKPAVVAGPAKTE